MLDSTYLFIGLTNLFGESNSFFLKPDMKKLIKQFFMILMPRINYLMLTQFYNKHPYYVENLYNGYMYNSYGDENFTELMWFFTSNGFSD